MQTSGGRMSNDLLFPILPRNTKVPIETDDREENAKDQKVRAFQ